MRVKDLKGKTHSWNLAGYTVLPGSKVAKSQGHLACRELLRELFPTSQILEEVPLPGTRMHGDFYLPMQKKMIEVHGRQHYQYVAHFHGSIKGFLDAKTRDAEKQVWCEINGIEYIALNADDTSDWRELLQ